LTEIFARFARGQSVRATLQVANLLALLWLCFASLAN
jgi:hypothetical protein